MTPRDHAATLERELRGIFGSRLQSLVVYGERLREGLRQTPHERDGHGADHGRVPVQTMAIVATFSQLWRTRCPLRRRAPTSPLR